jgi:hypothetical protein
MKAGLFIKLAMSKLNPVPVGLDTSLNFCSAIFRFACRNHFQGQDLMSFNNL